MTGVEVIDPSTVQPGLFRLTCEVQNPLGDRRNKHIWYKRASFQEGDLFRLKVEVQERETVEVEGQEVEIHPERELMWIVLASRSVPLCAGSRSVDPVEWKPHNTAMSTFYTELFEALEPVEIKDFDSWYALHATALKNYDGCRAILKYLVQQGKLSLGELEDLAEKVEDFEIFDAIEEPEVR